MRAITKRIAAAFEARKALTIDNTATDGQTVSLFGNRIIERRTDGVWWTLAGWNTPTTKERVSGITGVRVGSEYIRNNNIKSSEWYKV